MQSIFQCKVDFGRERVAKYTTLPEAAGNDGSDMSKGRLYSWNRAAGDSGLLVFLRA